MSCRVIKSLLIKHPGLAMPDPTHTTQGNCTALCVVTVKLVLALWGCAKFCSGDHAQLLGDGSTNIRRHEVHEYVDALVAADGGLLQTDA